MSQSTTRSTSFQRSPSLPILFSTPFPQLAILDSRAEPARLDSYSELRIATVRQRNSLLEAGSTSTFHFKPLSRALQLALSRWEDGLLCCVYVPTLDRSTRSGDALLGFRSGLDSRSETVFPLIPSSILSPLSTRQSRIPAVPHQNARKSAMLP